MFLYPSFSAESCQAWAAWAGQAYACQVDFRPNSSGPVQYICILQQYTGSVQQCLGPVCSNMPVRVEQHAGPVEQSPGRVQQYMLTLLWR